MLKAVFVLGTLEYAGVDEEGEALSTSTIDLLDRATREANIDASLVFVSLDPIHASRTKRDISMRIIREERPRVLSEISSANPDFIICFGPIASACVFNAGNLVEDDMLRRRFFPMGDDQCPAYVTMTVERARYTHALQSWLVEDIQWCASMSGENINRPVSVLGDWQLILPNSPLWRDCPPALNESSVVGFDLETYPSVSPFDVNARIRMAIFCTDPVFSYVVQLPPDSSMPQWARTILKGTNQKKVGSNIKFDVNWCRRFGVQVRNYEDTHLREHIMDPSSPRTDLKYLTFRYLSRLGSYAHDLHMRIKALRNDWSLLTDEEMHSYAAGDGQASIATYNGQKARDRANDKLLQTGGAKLLQDVYPILADLEYDGIAVSLEESDVLNTNYSAKLAELRTAIAEHLGPVNVDSTTQLAQALARLVPDIDLKPRDWRRLLASNPDEGEVVSTAKEVLKRESHRHPVIELVMKYRQFSTRYNTFVVGLRRKHLQNFLHFDGSESRHCIRPSYHISTETMRLASSRPNGMNMPRTNDDGVDYAIKRQFVSRFGYGGLLADFDMSQIEIRVAAMLSGDEAMIKALETGGDIHMQMASLMLGKPIAPDGEPVDALQSEFITKLERQACKTRTFLILYGGGAHKLGADLKISREAAQAMIDEYFGTFTGLKRYIDSVHAFVKEHGYVETPFGLRRYFVTPTHWKSRDGYSILRQAFNTKIQLTAALLMYVYMVELQKTDVVQHSDAVFSMQIHDSLIIDCANNYVGRDIKNATQAICQTLLTTAINRYGLKIVKPVPIVMEGTFGYNLALDRRDSSFPGGEDDGGRSPYLEFVYATHRTPTMAWQEVATPSHCIRELTIEALDRSQLFDPVPVTPDELF